MHTWNMQERSRVLNKPESVVFFTEKEINERRPKGKL
jgi:membrane-bound lytic murein transglycosylase